MPTEENESEEDSIAKPNPFLLILGILALIIWWLVIGLLPVIFYTDGQGRGTFGDMFGMVNSLFSGLAFAGLIYTVILQKQELGLQRKELKLTRYEMQNSSEAQQASAKALFRQVGLAADAARMNGLAALLQQVTSEINALRQHRDNNAMSPRYGRISLQYEGDFEIAIARRKTLIDQIETLSKQMESKSII